MIRMRALRVVSLGAALAACAGSVSSPPVAPADIPALEAQRQQRPGDVSVLTQLGIAYFDAKDYGHARDVLNGPSPFNPAHLPRRCISAWPMSSR